MTPGITKNPYSTATKLSAAWLKIMSGRLGNRIYIIANPTPPTNAKGIPTRRLGKIVWR